jgi:hypothetical protein
MADELMTEMMEQVFNPTQSYSQRAVAECLGPRRRVGRDLFVAGAASSKLPEADGRRAEP